MEGERKKTMKREIRWKNMRERERGGEGKNLYGLLGITRRTNQSQFGQCPKESIGEHYE